MQILQDSISCALKCDIKLFRSFLLRTYTNVHIQKSHMENFKTYLVYVPKVISSPRQIVLFDIFNVGLPIIFTLERALIHWLQYYRGRLLASAIRIASFGSVPMRVNSNCVNFAQFLPPFDMIIKLCLIKMEINIYCFFLLKIEFQTYVL